VVVGPAAVVVDADGASVVGGVRVVVVRGASVVDVWGTVVEVGVVELSEAFTSATTAITATIAIATARAIMSPLELLCWGAGAGGWVAGGSGIAVGGYHLPSVACHQPSPPDWSDTSISSSEGSCAVRRAAAP